MPAKPLNQLSGMPQISAAFMGWQSKVQIVFVTETIADGLVKTCETPITFQGVVQPLSPRQIALKPEGQRAWTWLMIHAFAGTLNLRTNDKILVDDKTFKVMGSWDYSRDNFIEYHLVKDYNGQSC